MQVIPAIDLRDGCCVQLVGGSYDNERVRMPHPLAVAVRWAEAGFKRLHVVDLDAATARGSNLEVVRELIGETAMSVQCGGGVRDLDTIEDLLAAGASAVVLGTKAIEDRVWLETAVGLYPNRLIVAADARGRNLTTHGWTETVARNVTTFVEELNELPLAAVLVTAVEQEGRMRGPDAALVGEITAVSRLPLQASGGVGSLADLRALSDAGASAAVVGMALYTGAVEARAIMEDFPQWQ